MPGPFTSWASQKYQLQDPMMGDLLDDNPTQISLFPDPAKGQVTYPGVTAPDQVLAYLPDHLRSYYERERRDY
jgi:hypothetical protein